jgi:hypothetical protein
LAFIVSSGCAGIGREVWPTTGSIPVAPTPYSTSVPLGHRKPCANFWTVQSGSSGKPYLFVFAKPLTLWKSGVQKQLGTFCILFWTEQGNKLPLLNKQQGA